MRGSASASEVGSSGPDYLSASYTTSRSPRDVMALNESADNDEQDQDGFLYAVLNVSREATQAEVHERYRSLSLVFHPDKQTDNQLKAITTEEFLKIQKAYQVLSDPFLRQVYDTLGSDGLKINLPPNLKSKSKEEIQETLNQMAINVEEKKNQKFISSKGKLAYTINLSSVTGLFTDVPSFAAVRHGIQSIGIMARSYMFSVERKINDKTAITFEADNSFQGRNVTIRFLGTVRHQFSPRITALATVHFNEPHFLRVGANYEDSNNSIEVKTALYPTDQFPTIATSFSRRLFRNGPQRGKVSLNISRSPSIAFFFLSPPVLHLEDVAQSPKLGPPSVSGLKYIAFERSCGISFDNILPKLIVEGAVYLIELSTRLRATLECSLAGLVGTLGITWSNEKAEAGTLLMFSAQAVVWEINFSYLEMQVTLPLFLSTNFSLGLAFTATVIPCTAISLGYHFFILPIRRAKRLAHIQASRQAFEEDLDSLRERNAVKFLLKDTVKKQIRIESGREGLIIQEAAYGASESEFDPYVTLDVTNQIQSLVRNSQLHIPGGDPRTALQGFSDPAPFEPKSLRIRYLFRSRSHYVEIPDYLPVVLPLAEHEVYPN